MNAGSDAALAERMIGVDASAAVMDAVSRYGLGSKLVLVCDDATWIALGEKIFNTCLADTAIEPHSLGRNPKACMQVIPALMEKAKDASGLLAVGAGTVNDVTKYAAYLLDKPYLAIATAASMNGYTSGRASLEQDGFKHSFTARPPKAVIGDLAVIAAAPKRLSRAGLGDTLARTTVEADCLLSHYLFGTDYPKEAFDCLRAHEEYLLSHAIDMTGQKPEYISRLLAALLDAGDWMARTGSSAIASQGEHMIAHTAEMMYAAELRQTFHGEMVGVATLAMNQLQHKNLLGAVTVKALAHDEAQFTRLFGKKMGAALAPAYAKKLLNAEQTAEINSRLATEWPEIKSHLLKVMRSPLTIERAFIQANLPYIPKHLGLSDDRFNSAVTYAHLTRDRFTFLDLAAMSGKRI